MKPWYRSNKLWTMFLAFVAALMVQLGMEPAKANVLTAAVLAIAGVLVIGKTSQNNTAVRAEADVTAARIYKEEAEVRGDADTIKELQESVKLLEAVLVEEGQ